MSSWRIHSEVTLEVSGYSGLKAMGTWIQSIQEKRAMEYLGNVKFYLS